MITRRYGLNDGRAQSHDEIGEWLGVGEERSRQIEREALHRLRSIAAGLTSRGVADVALGVSVEQAADAGSDDSRIEHRDSRR